MLSNKIFGVISLGCDKNRVDSEKLLGLIKDRGYRLTDDLKEAQIVIVNTCAFLQSAREFSRAPKRHPKRPHDRQKF